VVRDYRDVHPRHFEHSEWRIRLGHLLRHAKQKGCMLSGSCNPRISDGKQTDVSFQQAELASSDVMEKGCALSTVW